MKNTKKITYFAGILVLAGLMMLPFQSQAFGVGLGVNTKANVDIEQSLGDDWQDNEDLPHGIKIAPGIEKRIDFDKGLPHGIWKKFFGNNDDNDDEDEDTDENDNDIKISNLKVDTTDDSAKISFRTNVETEGELSYSTSSNMSDATEVDMTLDDEHSVTLNNLEEDEKYYFQIKLEDEDGDETYESDVRSFTTKENDDDESNPEIMFTQIFGVGSDSAYVIWVTDEKSDSKVWVDTDSDVEIDVDATLESDKLLYLHVFKIDDLEADTTYYLKVSSTDDSENVSTSSTLSFTTDED